MSWAGHAERVGRRGLDSSGSDYGSASYSCEHGNEPFDSTNSVEFSEEVNDH
jgi:hypothetical protein